MHGLYYVYIPLGYAEYFWNRATNGEVVYNCVDLDKNVKNYVER